MKKRWNIFICIFFSFGCSEQISVEDNETFYDELIKSSDNLTTFGCQISNFSDKYVEVRNTRGPISDEVSSKSHDEYTFRLD